MYIDQLVMAVHDDAVIAHTRCQTFMNACSSQPDPSTGTDKNFELAILGCTLDDQKRVKKRLQGLLDYFAKLNVTTCSWVEAMVDSKLVIRRALSTASFFFICTVRGCGLSYLYREWVYWADWVYL